MQQLALHGFKQISLIMRYATHILIAPPAIQCTTIPLLPAHDKHYSFLVFLLHETTSPSV